MLRSRRLGAVAFLIFLPTSAGAWVVTAHLGLRSADRLDFRGLPARRKRLAILAALLPRCIPQCAHGRTHSGRHTLRLSLGLLTSRGFLAKALFQAEVSLDLFTCKDRRTVEKFIVGRHGLNH